MLVKDSRDHQAFAAFASVMNKRARGERVDGAVGANGRVLAARAAHAEAERLAYCLGLRLRAVRS